MGPEQIGIIGLGILIVMLILGVPIAFTMVFVGLFGSMFLIGPSAALSNLGITAFKITNSYNFSIIPLFLLMSAYVAYSGIGKEAYDTARAWVGQIRGGLAMATVGACGLFAATSGSSMACAVAMGKVAYPEMDRAGYQPALASGCIAAGATLGILIPPSISFCVLGILMEVSIGKLFIAGILPGLSEIIFYWITIYIMCRINPSMGPAGPKTSLKEKVFSFKYTWSIILLFIIVMGGIYTGVFTPTEAGGIGAFGALIIGISRRKLSWHGFMESLKETMKSTAMVLFLLIGVFVFSAFMAFSRMPFVVSEYISGLTVHPYIILILILIVYIILGMFLDVMSIITLTIPILLPTIVALDFNLIWYGVLMVRVAEIGFVSPPFGLNIFALAGAVDVPLNKLYQGIYPFMLADILNVALLIAFPIISLLIPNLM